MHKLHFWQTKAAYFITHPDPTEVKESLAIKDNEPVTQNFSVLHLHQTNYVKSCTTYSIVYCEITF